MPALPEVHSPKVALVTGGSGFVGHHVVGLLQQRGVKVRVLLAPGDPAHNLRGLDVERAEADICNAEAFTRAAQGCDTIFHLAAIYALWLPRRERMYEVNVLGSLNAVRAAKAAGARRLILTSSIAAVGLHPGGLANENTVFNRWTEANDYVWSKYVSELEVLRESRALGVETVVVNPAFPLGPGDIGPTPTGAMAQMVLKGHFPAAFEGGTSAVDVRDVARGHVEAALRGRPYERYLLAGHNIRMQELAQRIAQVGGVRHFSVKLPRGPLLTAGWLAEAVSDSITHRPPPFTSLSLAYVVDRHLWYDISKAQEELGYSVRPLQETLADTVAWFRSPAMRGR